MFGSLSFNEILFIMVLALLIFGPKRLPQIGRTVGKALGEFRRATSDLKRSMEVEMSAAEEPQAAAPTPASVVAGTEPRRESQNETTVPSRPLLEAAPGPVPVGDPAVEESTGSPAPERLASEGPAPEWPDAEWPDAD